MKILDLTGKRFGSLVAIKCIGSRQEGKHRFKYWLCKCDCGNYTEVRASHLNTGQIHGCGCKRKLPKGDAAFNSLYDRYKRNASMRNLQFDLTKEQFKELTQQDCFYCGQYPSQHVITKNHGLKFNGDYVYNGVDRINNAKGYSLDNCAPCCKRCNWMKHDMSSVEFINHCKKVVSSVA